MARKSILFFFLISVLFSCRKDVITSTKKIQYQVTVLPDNKVSILYNSDYNIENNTQKEIEVTNVNGAELSGDTWFATHLQKGPEEYYIKVNFTNYNNPTNQNYGVFVFINDTLRDYVVKNMFVSEIELKGYIQ